MTLGRRGLRVAWLVMFGSAGVRVASAIFMSSDHWSMDDTISVTLLVIATVLLWFALLVVVRDTETRFQRRHTALEQAWRKRYDDLLAREREILRRMDEACAAADIPAESPKTERPALYVVDGS